MFRTNRLASFGSVLLLCVLSAAYGVSLAQEQPDSLLTPEELFGMDIGLIGVYEAALGTDLDLSQTEDGFTVTLGWAYADANRMAITYTITAPPGPEYTNLSAYPQVAVAQEGSTPVEAANQLGRSNAIEGTTSSGLQVLSLADILPDTETISVRVEFAVEYVTADRRTQLPMDRFVEMIETVETPFVFEFELPVNTDLRQLAEPQTTTDSDVAITLENVVVSQTQTRLTLCFDEPEAARQWTSIAVADVDDDGLLFVYAGTESELVDEANNRTCDTHLFNRGLADLTGVWQVNVFELVGFGERGDDQNRIAGDWEFEFVLSEGE